MHKRTSVIMTSAIAAILTVTVLAFTLPNHAFAYLSENQGQTNIAIGGNGGTGGAGGNGGIAGNGGLAIGGVGLGLGSGTGIAGGGNHVSSDGGDANGGHGGNSEGGDACFTYCKAG